MKTLLVVEDDLHFRRCLSLLLHGIGAECHMADNCDHAEHVLRENPTVAAVLLDKRLPGKNGPETLTVLRRVVPGLPVIFMTGEADWSPDVDGLVGVLNKPFKLEELQGVLESVPDREPGFAQKPRLLPGRFCCT
jgi:DNA-binding NtrC family response regulator